MANTYKNIVITPNIGNTSDPRVQFSGGNTTANTDINLYVYPTSNGTLSFEGSAGQLFSITNDLANLIFSVSDVSGIPSLEVYANSLVSVAPFGGNVVIGSTAELILSSGTGLHANGSFGTAGQVLTSNGTSVYWATAAAGGVTQVNTGNGMTGGPITTTGTVSVVAGNSQLISNSTGIWLDQTQVNHNSLTNYVADQHVAHSTITLTAGAGLTGGGTIAANRTFDIGAGNGMAVDADSIRVVSGNTTVFVNASGVFVNTSALPGVDVNAQYIWTNTHTFQNTITFSSALEIGATDTSLTRSAAGILAVEGVVIPTISSTNTLTNKRVTPRLDSYTLNGATPSINTDTTDIFVITGQTVNITSLGATGTPTNGQTLRVALTSGSGTPTIAWSASFESSTAVLPTTMSTTRKDVGFVWNAATSKWRCIAVA